MKIIKNNRTFHIFDKYSKRWFSNHIDRWELDTFHIFEYYKNHKKVYI